MNLTGNWNYPTHVRFGPGRIRELPEVCAAAGMTKPLIVTDPGISGLPMIKDAAKALGAPVFDGVQANPIAANVADGLKVLREGGHDGVVAFGGGSALDAGKVIAFMAGQTRPMWDFEDVGDWWTRADPAGIAPIVAAPTTSGTGSEVGRAGVITDETTHTKKIIFHPKMMPKTALLDPELTVGLPAKLTAGVGMDALSHCLEAYCAPGFHPLADGVALEGMRLVKDYLPRAVRNGADIEARGYMMAAAAMGATAFQKGLGAMHALSHPIGAMYGAHHGMTNAVFMPYVLEYNRAAISERISRAAAYLGLSASFEALLDWVLALRAEIGVPHTLVALGAPTHEADKVVQMALVDPTAGGNPVKLTAEGARGLFEAARDGRLARA
jgi:alcohol dehydrogenase